MRAVPEWIGKTPDAKVPPRVRLRIFERFNGICYLSKQPIRAGDKWELEHIIPLSGGGEHRESNMAPALVEPHKIKTRRDKAAKSKSYRIRARRAGINLRKGPPMPGSKLSKFKKKLNGMVVLR